MCISYNFPICNTFTITPPNPSKNDFTYECVPFSIKKKEAKSPKLLYFWLGLLVNKHISLYFLSLLHFFPFWLFYYSL